MKSRKFWNVVPDAFKITATKYENKMWKYCVILSSF